LVGQEGVESLAPIAARVAVEVVDEIVQILGEPAQLVVHPLQEHLSGEPQHVQRGIHVGFDHACLGCANCERAKKGPAARSTAEAATQATGPIEYPGSVSSGAPINTQSVGC